MEHSTLERIHNDEFILNRKLKKLYETISILSILLLISIIVNLGYIFEKLK